MITVIVSGICGGVFAYRYLHRQLPKKFKKLILVGTALMALSAATMGMLIAITVGLFMPTHVSAVEQTPLIVDEAGFRYQQGGQFYRLSQDSATSTIFGNPDDAMVYLYSYDFDQRWMGYFFLSPVGHPMVELYLPTDWYHGQ